MQSSETKSGKGLEGNPVPKGQQTRNKKPIDETDMLEFLNAKSDFAFELKALDALHQIGLVCQHGGTYVDSITEKLREFDIRGVLTKAAEGPPPKSNPQDLLNWTMDKVLAREGSAIHITLHFAIECKNIVDSPVLFCELPRRKSEAVHSVLFSPFVGESRKRIKPLRGEDIGLALLDGAGSWYAEGGRVGKSVNQIKRDKDAVVEVHREFYEKWAQALSSANDLVANLADWIKKQEEDTVKLGTVLAVVVVPDGSLWSVGYSAVGQILDNPKQVDRVGYFIDRTYPVEKTGRKAKTLQFNISHLQFVTLSGLQNLMNNLVNGNEMDKLIPLDAIIRMCRSEDPGLGITFGR